MLEDNKGLVNKEVDVNASEVKEFKKETINSIEKIEKLETKTNPIEKKVTPKPSVSDDRVIYSTKTGIIPNFGQINKGYTKVDKNKAKVLVNKYTFIRYASEEEIKTYVN
jgi:hypothetical protein